MIIENTPLSMTEAKEYFEKDKEISDEIKSFTKTFSKLKSNDGIKMREKIISLDMIKISPTHASKIIDLLPKTSEEINKIFIDISLNEEEINKILDLVKEFS